MTKILGLKLGIQSVACVSVGTIGWWEGITFVQGYNFYNGFNQLQNASVYSPNYSYVKQL